MIEQRAAAVDVMRRAHRDGSENSVFRARVAIEALVEILVDLIAVDAMRNDRRLPVVVARAPHVVVHGVASNGAAAWRRESAHRSAHRVDGDILGRGPRQRGQIARGSELSDGMRA